MWKLMETENVEPIFRPKDIENETLIVQLLLKSDLFPPREMNRQKKGGFIMDYGWMTAPCGLDCFNCHFFLASGNKESMEVLEE